METEVSGGPRLPLSLRHSGPVICGVGTAQCRDPGGPENLEGPNLAPHCSPGGGFLRKPL